MTDLIQAARHLPARASLPTLSVAPIRIPVPGRPRPLALRVTWPVPAAGQGALPVVLFSHGHGPSLYLSSLDGYAPLAGFLAGQGFAVIQPTHASSRSGGLGADAPGAPLFWRMRVAEMTAILDRLDEIAALIPGAPPQLNRDRIAAIGHSMGGQTVGMLLGARLTDPTDPDARDVDLIEPRIRAGVLLAAPGRGGDGLSAHAAAAWPALNPDFSQMTTPSLVVCGDRDDNPHLTTLGPAWHADPFHLSPGARGARALVTLTGAGHGLGGIAGYDAKETDDEDPDRLEATRRLTAAWLRSTLDPTDPVWEQAVAALRAHAPGLGWVEGR
ncbi:chlorophyllase (plasmid) [Tistrella mobilis]|uniref:alpha/beta hydrolase family protein n=1 Tax=Tistrella mobilis TaxID=171437 RepID=UPI003558DD69